MKEMVTTYYQDGTIKERFFINENGNKDGLDEYFYPNGLKKAQLTYEDGKLNGEVKEWDEEGNLEYEYFYINGLLNGKFINYYKSGVIRLIASFKKGEENGVFEGYHENGKKSHEYYVIDGKKEGIFRRWNKDGILKEIAFFVDDEEIEDAIFVVDNEIYSKSEYLAAYNEGGKEFKEKRVRGFQNLYSALKFLEKNSSKN